MNYVYLEEYMFGQNRLVRYKIAQRLADAFCFDCSTTRKCFQIGARMKPSEILTPETWIKGSYGKLPSGILLENPTPMYLSEKAPQLITFCMLGACEKCGIKEIQIKHKLRNIIERRFPDRYHQQVHKFNDHPDTTLEDVISVLQEAGL